MTQTVARIKRNGKNYEILVDLESALRFKKGAASIQEAVITEAVLHDL